MACDGGEDGAPTAATDARIPVGDGGSVGSLEGCDEEGGPCRCPVFERDGHRYVICADTVNWMAARAACRSTGMDLVSIGSAAEQEWLWTTLLDRYGRMDVWTGLNDRDAEGTFVWSNGEPLGWTGWSAGQPDSGGGLAGVGDEDCVELHSNEDGGWNDQRCTTDYLGYVCESL
jgi:hypothetical protein